MQRGKLSKPEPRQPQSKGNHFPEKKKEVPHCPDKKKEVPRCPEKKKEVPRCPEKKKEVPCSPEKRKEVPHSSEKKKEVPHSPDKKKEVPHSPDKKKDVPHCPEKKKEVPHCPEKKKEAPYCPEKKKEVPHSTEKKKEVPQYAEKKKEVHHYPEKKKEVHVPCTKEPANKIEVKVQVDFPHKFKIVIQDADSALDKSSTEKLYEQLYSGVFLNKTRKKFWVDKKSGGNSFMLFAKDMSIIWSEDSRYWKWISVKETCDVTVDAAELLDVCWLEIRARIDTTKLSPGILYEAAFVVMMKDHAYGWENPVNLELLFPSGCKKERQIDLREIKQRNQWTEIRVGEFITPENEGELEISLCGSEGLFWKKGLVIKGVVIRPKN